MKKPVTVERKDLLAAWSVLENLAVSLDQIGGMFAVGHKNGNGQATEQAFQKALVGYLNQQLVGEIRDARARLAQYISDADAEKAGRQISYWDYRTVRARSRPNSRRK